jgi:hypothetical protein
VVNVASKAFIVKQDLLDKEDTLVSSSHFFSSTFIELNNSFDEDVSPPMSFNMNVYGLFSALISNVYPMEDMLSNLNMVHVWSVENVIDCLKVMSVVPHLSNKLRSLDYNKIKVQYVSFLPITFNDNIIIELPPICLPTSHSGQMQSMDHKYNGHV